MLLLDAVTYAMSAALIMLISVSRRRDDTGDQQGTVGIWTEWLSGLRLVAHNRQHSAVFISVGTAMFGLGILNALMIVFVAEVFGGGALQLSSLLAAQAGGGLAAGLLLSQLGRNLQPTRLIPLGAVGMAVLLVAIVNSPTLAFAIVLTAILGAPIVAFFVSAQTLLHRGVSDAYRGRVFGAFSTTQALTMVGGMGLATLLGDWTGVLPLMHVAAVAFVAAAAFAALRLFPRSSEESTRLRTPRGHPLTTRHRPIRSIPTNKVSKSLTGRITGKPHSLLHVGELRKQDTDGRRCVGSIWAVDGCLYTPQT